MRRLGITLALAALVAGSMVADASAHEATLTGSDMDVGILDHDGFVWTVQLKARVTCSGADQAYISVLFQQTRSYGQIGGAAVVANPPANTWEVRSVMLPPGGYRVTFAAAACHSTAPMPEGHEGSHGDAVTDPESFGLHLPDCRPRSAGGARVALRSPLVPVVGDRTARRAQCPARLCDALGSASTRLPLVPVIGGGPPLPAPCPTIGVRRPNVPVDVVCGPGAVAARPSPLVPVRGAPCRGSVELVDVSAGAASASASRVLGSKRFRIRRGTFRAVRVPLKPAARRTLSLTRVLRVRAIVRSKAGRRKSKPFTVIKRG